MIAGQVCTLCEVYFVLFRIKRPFIFINRYSQLILSIPTSTALATADLDVFVIGLTFSATISTCMLTVEQVLAICETFPSL